MKVLRKIVGKIKIEKYEVNKSRNPPVSNILMSGLKEEGNRTNL